RYSADSSDNIFRYRTQQVGLFTQRGEMVDGLLVQLFGELARAVGAKEAAIGRLVVAQVRALGLAEDGGLALHIEDVVADLEGQPDAARVVAHQVQRARGPVVGIHGPELDAGADKRPRLAQVHALQVL